MAIFENKMATIISEVSNDDEKNEKKSESESEPTKCPPTPEQKLAFDKYINGENIPCIFECLYVCICVCFVLAFL